jgi:large subunit ribosomal protein L18
MSKIKRQREDKRKKRVRSKIFGTGKRPRLSIFRSNDHIYAQAIDDVKGVTLVSASDKEVRVDGKKSNAEKSEATGGTEGGSRKLDIAYKVGELIAKKAAKKKIKKVVFDRSGYKYHGRVASLAEGARKGGLKF